MTKIEMTYRDRLNFRMALGNCPAQNTADISVSLRLLDKLKFSDEDKAITGYDEKPSGADTKLEWDPVKILVPCSIELENDELNRFRTLLYEPGRFRIEEYAGWLAPICKQVPAV